MKIQPPKRIIKEDVEEQFRTLIDKIGYIINSFHDDVYNALNNNLSIEDNFTQSRKDITITVNASGVPTTPTQFKTGLSKPCAGVVVIRAQNTVNSTSYVTAAPFVSYTENNSIITVQQITGLPANTQFKLKLLLIP